MSEIKITSNQIKNLYEQTSRIYYLHSILNNILTYKLDFNDLEIATLSILNEKKIKSLRKQLLHLIPRD